MLHSHIADMDTLILHVQISCGCTATPVLKISCYKPCTDIFCICELTEYVLRDYPVLLLYIHIVGMDTLHLCGLTECVQ